ncbi:MAG TPA: winged helix-turn-helix domain-containing protein [Arenimonas sp.]|nr:winged helix-turn-helix domain-containing protein [Arenimonas sp.]
MANQNEDGTFRWQFVGYVFDEAKWQLSQNERLIDIEAKPLSVLAYLLRNAGRVVTKDELLECAWPGRVVVEASLTNAITKLRKALSDDEQHIVVTVPKAGYRFVAAASCKEVVSVKPAALLKQGELVPRRPNYRLHKCLDRNDFSEVWYAEHVKNKEQRVFKFSLDGTRLNSLRRESTVSRLLKESLGVRSDILRVMDWDFDEAPYFLEYEYGGVDLKTWSESIGGLDKLDFSVRLRLICEVCETLSAAHSVGVLHKDLKPSNILVYSENGSWKSRIADFGSARLLDPGRLDQLGITALAKTGQNLEDDQQTSTPLYASPEVLRGHATTVQSDIYAMGVMLYQMLIGDFREMLSPGWETRVDDDLLREDISKASAGDPELRFTSVAELARNLRTLEARRRTRNEQLVVQQKTAALELRMKKAKARRPWLLATFGTLSLGLVTSLYFYNQASLERLAALKQAHITRAVNQFLYHDILAAADPVSSGQTGITVKEALDKSAGQIDKRFAGQPEVAAEIHRIVGTAYYQVSEHENALKQYAWAADNFRLADGPNSPRALEAEALYAETLTRMSRYAEASAVLNKLKPQMQRQDAILAGVYYDRARAWWHFNQFQYRETVPALESALTRLAMIPDADPELEDGIVQALMVARQFAGYPLESLEQLQQRLVKGLAERKGAKAPVTLNARYAAARTLMILGKEREMEATYLELSKEMTEALGPKSEPALLIQHSLAVVYSKLQDWPQSERSGRNAYYGLQELMGPDSSNSYIAASTYAIALLRNGKYEQAVALLKRKLADLGDRSDNAAKIIRLALTVNLAHAYIEAQRFELAVPLAKKLEMEGGTIAKVASDAAGEIAYIRGAVMTNPEQRQESIALLKEGIRELSKNNTEDYWIIRNATALLKERSLQAKAEKLDHVVPI